MREALDFDSWLAEEIAERGAFTALLVLTSIAGISVTPQASSFVHVIGDEVGWKEFSALMASARVPWDGAALFVERAKTGGPIADRLAKVRLRALEERIAEDRLTLNEGAFFDRKGRRIEVEEIVPPTLPGLPGRAPD